MNPLLNLAISAARQAGRIIMRGLNRRDKINVVQKSAKDFVSDIDHQAEQVILDTIRKAYPDHGFLAEESGSQEGKDYQWIIDPLDGTTNFLHGFPQFCVSIALQHEGKIILGVVYDPSADELFSAMRGSGAFLNERRVRVTTPNSLSNTLIGTGFPFKNPQYMDSYLKMFRAVSSEAADLRRAGSAALDLAYVACGRLDGFWEIGLQPWDMAAGTLLVNEAGGLVSDFGGGHQYLTTGNVVTGSPKVFKGILQKIQPSLVAGLKA